jgi:hypothetical protein
VIEPWPLATFGFSNRDKRSYFFFDSTHTRQRANGLNHASGHGPITRIVMIATSVVTHAITKMSAQH